MTTPAMPHTVGVPTGAIEPQRSSTPDWQRMAIGGAMLTGAVLLLSGKRKAGVLVSAAATALTLLEEQDALRSWWETLPRYLDDAQHLLEQAQTTLDDLTHKREKLRAMFNR